MIPAKVPCNRPNTRLTWQTNGIKRNFYTHYPSQTVYLLHWNMLSMIIQTNWNLGGKSEFPVSRTNCLDTDKPLIQQGFNYADLKNMGWSVKEGAEESLPVVSSLLEKPLWFKPLWEGSEMIGAGSWLLLVCLEKLQEISGVAAFLIETQTAVNQNISEIGITNDVWLLLYWLVLYFTFLRRCREKLHFGSKTGKEVFQEEQCVLQRTKQESKKTRKCCYLKTGKCVAQIWCNRKRFTWSILRRRGVSETRKQHSCGAWLDSGHMCRAFTVS